MENTKVTAVVDIMPQRSVRPDSDDSFVGAILVVLLIYLAGLILGGGGCNFRPADTGLLLGHPQQLKYKD
jgi:hypothetical protein